MSNQRAIPRPLSRHIRALQARQLLPFLPSCLVICLPAYLPEPPPPPTPCLASTQLSLSDTLCLQRAAHLSRSDLCPHRSQPCAQPQRPKANPWPITVVETRPAANHIGRTPTCAESERSQSNLCPTHSGRSHTCAKSQQSHSNVRPITAVEIYSAPNHSSRNQTRTRSQR